MATYSFPVARLQSLLEVPKVRETHTCTLLRLDQTCRAVNTYDQAARDLRVKSSTVSRLLYS